MIFRYFDPSAWVKRYFQEEGSEAVNAMFRTFEPATCCRLGFVEMAATIARKCHEEMLDKSVVEKLLENVREDFAEFRVIPIDETKIVTATELAIRHRLRTMDAVHLACALYLRRAEETMLVSADHELLAAAVQENLPVLNPGHG